MDGGTARTAARARTDGKCLPHPPPAHLWDSIGISLRRIPHPDPEYPWDSCPRKYALCDRLPNYPAWRLKCVMSSHGLWEICPYVLTKWIW